MNTQNENHAPTVIDDPKDRLIDVALTELIGGATPPDLSARILASNANALLAKPQPATAINYSRRFRWIGAAVAASLLFATVGYLISGDRSSVAKKAASSDLLNNQQKQISKLVSEFNQLREAQRFEEMELVARRLIELAPNDPVAQQVWLNTKFIRREMMNHQLVDDKESSIWNQLSAIDQSAIDPVNKNGKEVSRDVHYWNSFDKDKKSKQLAERELLVSQSKAVDMPQEHFYAGGRPAIAANPANLPASIGPAAPAVPEGGQPVVVSQAPNRTAATPSDGADYQNMYLGADGKQQQASSNTTQLSAAPRQQLGPATDGTLDLYAHGEATQNTAQYATPLYAFTDPRLHKSEGPAEVALRPQMPSLQQWNERDRAMFRPDRPGDQYPPIVENPFIKAEGGDAVSTFGIDVDTASYSNIRQFLLDMHQLPPVNAVRIEELVNYFHYDYAGPSSAAPGSAGGSTNDAPFAAHVEVAGCPWNQEHRLARIAVKGREMARDKRPQSNLVFLVDVSGSMNDPVRLPLVKYGLEQLTKELGENDHIAIVTYAGTTGVALPSTSGANQKAILKALRKLKAEGSTAGGAGLQLAYQIAEESFIKGGTNRIILCTDGDFNVGTTNTDELQKLVAQKAKDTGVSISTLGFGRDNLNDAMMVAISDHGNGNYHYIDNRTEIRRVLVDEMTGTLVTIAKDVKIQVEFNPAQVAAYRLIGYEKRMLKTEDFNNDKKDAGEIGAGHTVTALYEIAPAGKPSEPVPPVDELKYQKSAQSSTSNLPQAPVPYATSSSAPTVLPAAPVAPSVDSSSSELLTLKMRYKAPDGDTSQKLEWPVTDNEKSFDEATEDFRFATAVAGFGMLLRDSQYKGDYIFRDVLKTAENAIGRDDGGYRTEFCEMVKEAQRLKGE